MNIAYLQFNFIEKSSPYSSVPLYHNTAGPEAFLMATERKSIKFAALAFPPCYLFTGLGFFSGWLFFLFLQAVSLNKYGLLPPQEKRFEMYFQMQNSP